jgi:hypothetical protein
MVADWRMGNRFTLDDDSQGRCAGIGHFGRTPGQVQPTTCQCGFYTFQLVDGQVVEGKGPNYPY